MEPNYLVETIATIGNGNIGEVVIGRMEDDFVIQNVFKGTVMNTVVITPAALLILKDALHKVVI